MEGCNQITSSVYKHLAISINLKQLTHYYLTTQCRNTDIAITCSNRQLHEVPNGLLIYLLASYWGTLGLSNNMKKGR